MDSRWKEISRSEKHHLIKDIYTRFEDVRINYERIREGKPIDPKFEIRGSETIALTDILRDLRVHRPLLTGLFYTLMMQRMEAAGALAKAIRSDDSTWRSAMVEWERMGQELSKAIGSEFYTFQ